MLGLLLEKYLFEVSGWVFYKLNKNVLQSRQYPLSAVHRQGFAANASVEGDLWQGYSPCSISSRLDSKAFMNWSTWPMSKGSGGLIFRVSPFTPVALMRT